MRIRIIIKRARSLPSTLGQWEMFLTIYTVYAEETELAEEVTSMRR